MSTAAVVPIREQSVVIVIVVPISRATPGISYDGEGCIGIAEAHESVLSVIVVVVGEFKTKSLPRIQAGGKAIITIVASIVGQSISVRTFPEIDGTSDHGPRLRSVS